MYVPRSGWALILRAPTFDGVCFRTDSWSMRWRSKDVIVGVERGMMSGRIERALTSLAAAAAANRIPVQQYRTQFGRKFRDRQAWPGSDYVQ